MMYWKIQDAKILKVAYFIRIFGPNGQEYAGSNVKRSPAAGLRLRTEEESQKSLQIQPFALKICFCYPQLHDFNLLGLTVNFSLVFIKHIV